MFKYSRQADVRRYVLPEPADDVRIRTKGEATPPVGQTTVCGVGDTPTYIQRSESLLYLSGRRGRSQGGGGEGVYLILYDVYIVLCHL